MTLNDYAVECHTANIKWWYNPITGEYMPDRNVGEMLMLMVSELAEALEGHRKGLNDDKLPHRQSLEVELVDALIRIFDLAGARGLDLEGAYQEKMAYNTNREDHKLENRLKPGGKKY